MDLLLIKDTWDTLSLIIAIIPMLGVMYAFGYGSVVYQNRIIDLWTANEILKSFRSDEIPNVDLEKLVASQRNRWAVYKSLSLTFGVEVQKRFAINRHYQSLVKEYKTVKCRYNRLMVGGLILFFVVYGILYLVNS